MTDPQPNNSNGTRSPPNKAITEAARWAVEQDLGTAREATKSAVEMSKTVLTSLLTINGGGVVVTLGLFGHFVTASKDFSAPALQSLSAPGAVFALGMVAATLSAFFGYLAELSRSNLFASPWEQLSIEFDRNETVLTAVKQRAQASLINFRFYLALAFTTATVSLGCFLIGMWVLTHSAPDLKPLNIQPAALGR